MIKGKGDWLRGRFEALTHLGLAGCCKGMADKCLRRQNWLGPGDNHWEEAPAASLACADLGDGWVSYARRVVTPSNHCHHLSSGPWPSDPVPVSSFAPLVYPTHQSAPSRGGPQSTTPLAKPAARTVSISSISEWSLAFPGHRAVISFSEKAV